MINRMLLRLLPVAVAAVLLVPTAGAEAPTKEPVPFPEGTGQFCKDFAVHIAATQNKEFAKVFSSGATLVTGVLKVEVTNVATGKSLVLNISGPGRFDATGDGLSGSGRWLLFGEAGQLPGPNPGMLLTTGWLALTLGPAGIASIEVRGTTEDVCAMLAS